MFPCYIGSSFSSSFYTNSLRYVDQYRSLYQEKNSWAVIVLCFIDLQLEAIRTSRCVDGKQTSAKHTNLFNLEKLWTLEVLWICHSSSHFLLLLPSCSGAAQSSVLPSCPPPHLPFAFCLWCSVRAARCPSSLLKDCMHSHYSVWPWAPRSDFAMSSLTVRQEQQGLHSLLGRAADQKAGAAHWDGCASGWHRTSHGCVRGLLPFLLPAEWWLCRTAWQNKMVKQ